MKPFVSIIIPTYKRAAFLKYSLEAIKKQTYKDFEVVVVVKAGGDETEKMLAEYMPNLNMKVIMQKEGFVSKAYNLGLEVANGEIIVIMDDDSVPDPNLLEKYVEIYDKYPDVGGVSGLPVSADFDDNEMLRPVRNTPILHMKWHQYYLSRWSYNRPLAGMNDWLIFFGRDGLVHHRPLLLKENLTQSYPSLLFMGANMSVRKKAIEGVNIDENLLLGFAYEQLLGLQIWRKGYRVLYDPRIKLFHIVHEESLGRFFKTPLRAAHREAEYVLTFFILKTNENEISWIPYILELATLTISRIRSARKYGLNIALSRVHGLLYGFVVGCAYNISKALGTNFSIKKSLNKFIETSRKPSNN